MGRGYDGRVEAEKRRAAEETTPLCPGCPRVELGQRITAAIRSEDSVRRQAGLLARDLLRRADCPSPEEEPLPDSTEVGPEQQLMQPICANPAIEVAQTVLTHTEAVLAELPLP
jgi:hypothetical protein